MGRTPLFSLLQRIFGEHQAATQLGCSVEEMRERRLIAEERQQGEGISRRGFLAGSAALAALSAAPILTRSRRANAATTPRVAIIGGGIAGLAAALQLKDAGIPFTIYEAMESSGGRMRSDTPTAPGCGTCHSVGSSPGVTWLDSQVTDIFGEMIDTDHTTMQALAKRFNLPLVDLLAAQPKGSTDTNYFFNKYYTKAQTDADYKLVLPAIKKDLLAAGYPTTYNNSTPGGRALDSMSVYDWIESRVPGGHSSAFGRLLDAAYAIEYGADTTDQTSLGMLYLIGYNKGPSFNAFGPSDERYRIVGGVERLPKAIAGFVGTSNIQTDNPLEKILKKSDGTYELTLHKGVVTADIVLLALPFAALQSVDYSQAGFDSLKVQAITQLGKGHNGKLHVQFTSRLWTTAGPWGKGNGNCYGDTGFQATWESTRGQAGTSGIIVNYTGGAVADAMQLQHPYGNTKDPRVIADAQRFLTQFQPLFPGISAKWNGRAAGSMAHRNPWWNASYCYWKVGQAQRFGGYEGVKQGNIYFAGEHTSVDYQGFMEGAASEGTRAGQEIVAQIKGTASLALPTQRRAIG